MALSIPELVFDDIVAALGAVDMVAGYPISFSSVERRKEPVNLKADWKCVVGIANPSKEDVNVGWPLEQWLLRFDVDVFVPTNESSATPADVALLQAWASVVRAVMADPQRQGLALETITETPTLTTDGVVVPVTVRTRWLATDMARQ